MQPAHMRRQDQQQQLRLKYSPRVTAVLLALIAALRSASGVPLSDWHDGIATNYGGAQDGMNPYDPSFGTKDVSSAAPPSLSLTAMPFPFLLAYADCCALGHQHIKALCTI